MLLNEDEKLHHVAVDIDNGGGHRSSEGCSGDREEEEGRGCSDGSGAEIVGVCEKERGRGSSASDSECSVEVVDLEGGEEEVTDGKVHLAKVERDCRICHLSMDMSMSNQESGTPIELGCSCKDDLAAAHKQCAEAWFKIKGNK